MTTSERPKRPRRPSRPSDKSALESGVALTIDGDTYEVRLGDINAEVAREFRREMHISARSFLFEELAKDPDIDTFAAFIWLARMVTGDRMPLDSIAVDYGMLGDDFDIKRIDTAPEVGDSPEA